METEGGESCFVDEDFQYALHHAVCFVCWCCLLALPSMSSVNAIGCIVHTYSSSCRLFSDPFFFTTPSV